SYMSQPVSVVAVEIARNVLADRSFKRREAGIISGATQSLDARLGEVLILSADRPRHIDVFDIRRLTQRLEHGTDHIAETLRLSGADVENTIDACCLQQPPQYGNRIVYIDEVAALVTIGDSITVRLEQLHRLARLCQIKDFGKNACHVPLVIFVRAIDVGKLQPDTVR